jgi:hypothetical protein
MEKKEILKRLWATIKKLVNLPDENFKYNLYVTKGDVDKGCGTVCCVAGWYPKWFPESGLKWRLIDDGYNRSVTLGYWEDLKIDILSDYHGLSLNIIYFLFYGNRIDLTLSRKGLELKEQIFDYWKRDVDIFDAGFENFRPQIKTGDNASKSQVIMGFRFIHYLIQNDYITDYENT